MQGDTEGTIHPNGRGHQVIGEAVAASVRNNTINKHPPGPAIGIQGPQLGDVMAVPAASAEQPGQQLGDGIATPRGNVG